MDNELKNFLFNQKEQLEDLEKVIRNIENSDLNVNNKNLENQVSKLRKEVEEKSKKLNTIEKDYDQLKSVVLLNHSAAKESIINSNIKESTLYFNQIKDSNINELDDVKNKSNREIKKFKSLIDEYTLSKKENIQDKITALETEIYTEIDNSKKVIENKTIEATEKMQLVFSDLNNSEIKQETIENQLKKNSFELKFGVKWANILGIIFVLFAILSAAKYSYTTFFQSNELKAVLFYFIGISLLIGGEFLNKRSKNFFSLSTTGGGIAILFMSTAVSYLYFDILSMYTALLLCILVSLVSFFLSIKYDAQVIAILALVGGYLPIVSANQVSDVLFYSIFAYFVLLNVFSSFLSYRKNYVLASYFSIFLNFISFYYMFVFISNDAPVWFSLIYTFITLIFYMYIILAKNLKDKSSLILSSRILLIITSLLSCSLVFTLSNIYKLSKLNGLFAIALFAFFFTIAKLVEKTTKDKNTFMIFYTVAFIFSILVVPLQLGLEYSSLGWLLEGTVLVIYGLRQNEGIFKYVGLIIVGLATSLFILWDINANYIFNFYYNSAYTSIFFRYLAVIFSHLLIIFYTHKTYANNSRVLSSRKWIFFKIAQGVTVFNLLIFIIATFIYVDSKLDVFSHTITMIFSTLIVLTLYSLLLPNIKFLASKATTTYKLIISGLIYLTILTLGFFYHFVDYDIATGIIFILANILIVFEMFTLQKVISRKFSQIVFNVLSILLAVSIMLSNGISSTLFTAIFMISALIYIVYGFYYLDSTMRRFGLILILISISKLFIFDLIGLGTFERIISYFVFGFTLMAVSFFYQYFVKKLELRLNNEKENID